MAGQQGRGAVWRKGLRGAKMDSKIWIEKGCGMDRIPAQEAERQEAEYFEDLEQERVANFFKSRLGLGMPEGRLGKAWIEAAGRQLVSGASLGQEGKKALSFLAALGLDLLARDRYERTMAMAAAQSGNVEALEEIWKSAGPAMLMESQGAVAELAPGKLGEPRRSKIDLSSSESRIWMGQSLLAVAVKAGQPGAARWALGKGANPKTRDAIGLGLLHMAAESGQPELVRLLMDKGLDPDDDFPGPTPLMWAALSGQAQTARALLEGGAQARRASAHWGSCTAMHCAAISGSAQIAAMLAEAGASWTRKDALGVTPEEIAQRNLAQSAPGKQGAAQGLLDVFVEARKAEKAARAAVRKARDGSLGDFARLARSMAGKLRNKPARKGPGL